MSVYFWDHKKLTNPSAIDWNNCTMPLAHTSILRDNQLSLALQFVVNKPDYSHVIATQSVKTALLLEELLSPLGKVHLVMRPELSVLSDLNSVATPGHFFIGTQQVLLTSWKVNSPILALSCTSILQREQAIQFAHRNRDLDAPRFIVFKDFNSKSENGEDENG